MKFSRWTKLSGAFVGVAVVLSTVQATPVEVSTPRATIPPNIVSSSNKPMLMLATSKDHTLFGPIYTDFEDLDGDGVIDTTFKPDFKYYGYFDPTKCYTYTNSRFEPNAVATVSTDGRYVCGGSNQWSGNFMNWATMTRLDVIRKMLYGGKRSTDTATATKDASGLITAVTSSLTVLERTNLSMDSHSFVKYYRGTDIRDYTPYTTAQLTKATGSNKNVYAGMSICNRSTVMGEGGTPVIRLAKGNYRLWATVEGTVCEWGVGVLGKKLGRYYLDADKGNGGISHEVDPPDGTKDSVTGATGTSELNVRVQVCSPSMLGEERCMAVPANLTSNYKPYGIFQEFGLAASASVSARAEFGVLTGSYDKNTNAGALRKRMGDFSDEINIDTGVFCHSASGVCSGNTADGRAKGSGAIKSIDSFVLYGRVAADYGSDKPLPKDLSDGTLPAWGNPIGEMVVQALQYYAGVSQTNAPAKTKDESKGLVVQDWNDPLSNDNAVRRGLFGNSVCRPMYTMALSSSALSFDGATKTGGADSQASTAFNTLVNKSGSIAQYTDKIGVAEGINGTVRSIGTVDGTFGQSCSSKTLGQLSLASGVCPDAPGMGGTYQVAGAALYANTAKIRNLTTPPPDIQTVQDALKVKTLAASLSGGAARIEVPIPGTSPTKYVYITPESLWNGGGNKQMPGALLTFASISSGTHPSTNMPYGAFVVTWNDAQLGGDYDMDIAGFIRYDVERATTAKPSPTGYNIKITTDILNVGAGDTGTHGFSVMGTNRDKRYLTHRHMNSDAIMAGAEGELQCLQSTAGASRCNVSSAWNVIRDADYPYSETFQMIGVDNVLVQDPLWYAAKYGYFTSSTRSSSGTYTDLSMPPNKESWDRLKADGTSGSDGVPDGYFLARRPDILETQLRKALDALVKSSNAAPAISSAQFITDEFKYVAKFDAASVSGTLEAYKINSEGYFDPLYTWEAGKLLYDTHSNSQGGSREIITNAAGAGVAFRWGAVGTAYQTQMTTASTNVVSTANAQHVLNYIRGNQTLEGPNGLRARESNLLGPLVNGTPWLQTAPSAAFYGSGYKGYSTFYNDNKDRKQLLWVPSNDGMLHAFNAKTGAEVFAYVPGVLANRLAEIPLQRGTTARTRINGVNFTTNDVESKPDGIVWAYVDGSPFVADVNIGTSANEDDNKDKWRSYLFGALGRGGKAIYALDVSDVGSLTETNASSVFKWQFTSDDDADLGYIISDTTLHTVSNQALPVVRLNNGKYAVMFGNGQKSASGKAVLYILYVQGPNNGNWTGQYKKIVADATLGNNGLSTPRWEDYDGDGIADVAYAGDLQGNMWKFNLSGADDTAWDVAYKGNNNANKPLYRATTTVSGVTKGLPITTAPVLLYMGKGGLLVNFATGNAFETPDFATGMTYRVYGIWDRTGLNVSRDLPSGTSTLVSRTASRGSGGVVTLTGDVIDWTTKDGWYWNFPVTQESVLSNPSLNAGVFSFVTVRPITADEAAVACNATPNATLYTVDPISGKAERNSQGAVTVGSDKVLVAGSNFQDQKVSYASNNPSRGRTKVTVNCTRGTEGCKCDGDGQDANCTKQEAICGPGQRSFITLGGTSDAVICYSSTPRMHWREIPGIRTLTPE
ncbi:pilus assembly protein PilY [Diaphorobacter sp. HDW4B]|uniref:pilus assembly protein n=1 Tax=Diaphorobacter sp. HDW4B TaxID=2714925 RepID=UPI00140B3782|nr:PilC/PilY family type IV pilus protein [Diaphorobacter sp. HDW4B]QIL72040.1 pilus assembly protein PilY [Diaphorobacter sp. HDW4B]